MLTVHHLENSRSQRILWLLEELQLDYHVQRYERDPKTSLAPESLKTVHPLGKSPVLTDDEFVLAETGAIIEYLVRQHGNGQLQPEPNTPEFWDYTYWLHAAEGSIMPLLVMKLIFNKTTEPPVPLLVRPISKAIAKEVGKSYLNPNLNTQLAYANEHLSQSAWFAGKQFTAADVMMSFPLEAAATRMDMSEYPKLEQFVATVKARPAYQKALAVGGPYDY